MSIQTETPNVTVTATSSPAVLAAVLAEVQAKTSTLKSLKEQYAVLHHAKNFKDAESIVKWALSQAEEAPDVAEQEPLTLREQVLNNVKALLERESETAFDIARNLHDVKQDFEKAGEFIDWCKQELMIGKAQVYHYLKIHTVFGSEPAFRGVPYYVLRALCYFDKYDYIQERVHALALAKELDKHTATELMQSVEPAKPEPVEKPAPAKGQAEGSGFEDVPVQSTPLPAPIIDADTSEDEAPWESDASTTQVQLTNEVAESSELARLTAQIERLTDQLADANRTIADLSQRTERSNNQRHAPELPQFKSQCLYARLGLGQLESEDHAKVRKAYRELVRVGYGESHPSHEDIKQAFEYLTK